MAYFSLILIIIVLGILILWTLRRTQKTDRENRVPVNLFDSELAQELMPGQREKTAGPLPVEVPQAYDDTRVVLMVRDPEWLFVYWEIGSATWEALNQNYGEIAPRREDITLRIFEISNDMSYFDISVGSYYGDWHIKVGKPDTSFFCLIGLKSADDFYPLAASNSVTTPREGLSPAYDDEWMLVTDREQRMLNRIGKLPLDLSSPFLFRK
jgi:hypothetical protein